MKDLGQVLVVFQRLGRWYKEIDNWRCPPEPVRGEIHGLPGSDGMMVATNGILCLIERLNEPPFEGHLDFFVPYNPKDTAVIAELKPVTKKPKKAELLAAEYL
tara:strand:- start:894 stop:1202 length:309 start_codon:yes stop_codon:yes gene_type:complete